MTTTRMLDNLPSKKQLSCLKLAAAKRSPKKGFAYVWECPDCWVAGDCDHQLRFYVDEPMVSSPLAHDPKRLSAGAVGLSPGDDSGEFPEIFADRPTASTTGDPVFYPAGELLLALRHCSLACDADNSRYAMGGVLLESDRLAGTDGRRLHWADIETGESGKLDKDPVILPIAAVKLLIGLLPDCRPSDSIVVQVSAVDVTLLGNTKSGGSWKYVTRRIQGRFPRIDSIIESCETPIRSNGTAEYHADIARACKLLDKEVPGANVGDGKFAYRGIDGQFFPGLCDMILDIVFLRDSLANMEGSVDLGFSDREHAVRMDCGHLHAILMPMAKK